MSPEHTRATAALLRDYATHFADEDWEYTRDLGNLVEVRRDEPYDRLGARVKRATAALFLRRSTVLPAELLASRWSEAKAHLRRHKQLPDGVLDNGSIITTWEEHGEYLQLVQPRVGEIVAAIMDEHPDLALVQALAKEIDQIQQRYAERIIDGGAL